MKRFFYAILITVFAFIQPMFGQILRSPNFKTPAGMTEAEVGKIISTLDLKLAEYKKAGTLLDKKCGCINRESANAFKGLFELDGKIFNDLQEFPDETLYEIDGYTNIARNYFSQGGINFAISDAEIQSITPMEDEYICSVFLVKSTDKYYDSKANIISGTRAFNLEFVYGVRKNNQSNPKIKTIRPSIKPKNIANYVQYIGIDLRGGLQQASFTQMPGFNSTLGAKGAFVIEKGVSFGGGFVWYSNFFNPPKGAGKNLFATVGVQASYSTITAKLTDYSTPSKKTTIPLLSDKNIELGKIWFKTKSVAVTEEMSLVQVQIPIGVSYRLFKLPTSAVHLDVTYIPALSVYTASTLTGKGIYDHEAYYGNKRYSVLDDLASKESDPDSRLNQYLIDNPTVGLDKTVVAPDNKPQTTLSQQVGLSAVFFKDFVNDSPTFGIAFGINAVFGLTSFLQNKDINSPLFDFINQDGSMNTNWILGTYLQKVRLSNFGLRVIVYRKTSRKP